jgi:hypothetical protein
MKKPSPAPTSTRKKKKGIGMALRQGNEEETLAKVIALDPYWNHAWNPVRVSNQPDFIEFVSFLNSARLKILLICCHFHSSFSLTLIRYL